MLQVFKSYKILSKTTDKKLGFNSGNLVVEPVRRLEDLEFYIKQLDKNKTEYILAAIDTVIEGRFGDRYQKAYGLFSLGGELIPSEKQGKIINLRKIRNRKNKDNFYG